MSNKNLLPVLFVTNFDNRLGGQQTTKLQGLGLNPTLTCKFSSLPDVLTLQKGPFAAVVFFQDQAIQGQVQRAKSLADKAGLPLLRLLSQTSRSKEVIDSLFPKATGKDLLGYLVVGVEDKGRPWGWVRAYQEGGFVRLPDTLDSVESFLSYITRLGPEDLPESLRDRSKVGLLAPKSDRGSGPVSPVQESEAKPEPAPTTPSSPWSVEETEEYRLLKEEYDTMAFSLAKLREELKEVADLAESRQKKICELESVKRMTESELPRMVTQWEAKGERAGREQAQKEMEGVLRSLRDQIETLQKDLEDADQALVAQQESHQKELQSFRVLTALREAGFDLVEYTPPKTAPQKKA